MKALFRVECLTLSRPIVATPLGEAQTFPSYIADHSTRKLSFVTSGSIGTFYDKSKI